MTEGRRSEVMMNEHPQEPWDKELKCREGHRVRRLTVDGPAKRTKVRLPPPGLDTPYVCERCPERHLRRDLLPPLADS